MAWYAVVCIPFFLIAVGLDYTGGLLVATFSGSSTTSVQIPTLSDYVLEGVETFTGVIQVPPNTTSDTESHEAHLTLQL